MTQGQLNNSGGSERIVLKRVKPRVEVSTAHYPMSNHFSSFLNENTDELVDQALAYG
jgi:hypothetical protein